MGYIDYCSLCKYSYTSDCKYASKECNQEKARILLEISNKKADVQPTERGKYTNVIKVLDKRASYFGNLNRNIEEEREMFALKVAIEVLTKLNGGAENDT